MGKKRTFHTLNAIRGVAALGVFGFHAPELFGVIAPHGYLAVDLFFVLSGFVVAFAYEERLMTGLGVAAFGRLRVLRFYPLYLLGLGFGVLRELALLATHNPNALPPPMLAAATALASVFLPLPMAARDLDLFTMNVPAWSLFYELIVNLLFAASIRYLTHRRLAAVILVSGLIFVTGIVTAGSADLGAKASELGLGLARTIFSFGLGVALHRLQLRVPARLVPPWTLLVAVAAGLAMPASAGAVYDLAFVLLVAPALVLLGSTVEPKPRYERAFVYLGVISFPLYAIHGPLVDMANSAARITGVPGWMLGIALTIGLLVATPLLDRYYDAPLRRWLSGKPKPRVPEIEPVPSEMPAEADPLLPVQPRPSM